MDITQQDRQLAERIWQEFGARDIETARNGISDLLAEAREAQHKASWAMATRAAARELEDNLDEPEQGEKPKSVYSFFSQVVSDIRALPTPPITNEGE